MYTYLLKVLRRHLRQDLVEVLLVGLVHQTVVENPLALVAVEPEDVVVLSDHTRICLQHSYIHVHVCKWKYAFNIMLNTTVTYIHTYYCMYIYKK